MHEEGDDMKHFLDIIYSSGTHPYPLLGLVADFGTNRHLSGLPSGTDVKWMKPTIGAARIATKHDVATFRTRAWSDVECALPQYLDQ